jgi:hypothetical protein
MKDILRPKYYLSLYQVMTCMLSWNYSAAFTGFLFMMSILFLQTQPLEASSKSPCESGFDHGCEDIQIR